MPEVGEYARSTSSLPECPGLQTPHPAKPSPIVRLLVQWSNIKTSNRVLARLNLRSGTNRRHTFFTIQDASQHQGCSTVLATDRLSLPPC